VLGLPHFVGAGLLAAGLTGCTLLDVLLGVPPFDPNDPSSFPDFSFPPLPTAASPLTEGGATLELIDVAGTQTIVLDRLAGDSAIEADYGTRVVWTNGAGWFLTIYSYTDEPGLPASAYLTVDHVAGDQHRIVVDPSRCVTTLDPTPSAGPGASAATAAAGISGTSTCRGLRWADFFSGYSTTGFPEPLPDLPAFDAEITFEAH